MSWEDMSTMALSLCFCVYVCVCGRAPLPPLPWGFLLWAWHHWAFHFNLWMQYGDSDSAQYSRTWTPPLGTPLLICSQDWVLWMFESTLGSEPQREGTKETVRGWAKLAAERLTLALADLGSPWLREPA